MLRVLISGAGIARATLGYWLGRAGYDVTLIERAPAPRPGGQAIDVRGTALEVLARMDLLEECHKRRTTMRGVSLVDAEGTEVWRSEQETLSGGRFDAGDVEILRDDLSSLLCNKAARYVETIYDETVIAIADSRDGIQVGFSHTESRRYDILIGADGLRSCVRNIVFGEDKLFVYPLGVALAVFTCPNFLELKDWQIAHREGKGGFLIYTARGNRELRVAFGIPLDGVVDQRLTIHEQKELVFSRSRHFGWHVPRLLDEMQKAADFYYGSVAQVKMPSWSRGRCVLVGDAAYSPSPFSGQGTSLALVGAYVLAQTLVGTGGDYEKGFASYERRIKNFVELNQNLVAFSGDKEAYEQNLAVAKAALVLDSNATK